MLRTRLLTAIVLLALIAAAAIWSPVALQALCAVLVGVAMREWLLLAGNGRTASMVAGIVFGGLLVATSLARVQAPASVVAIACALACALWVALGLLIVRAQRTTVVLGRSFSTALAVAALVPGWMALTSLLESGIAWLLSAMAVVWVADIGAYFTGRACGRHKLAPRVSPGKTWEGVAGAVASVMLVALAAHVTWPGETIWSNRLLARVPAAVAGLALVAVVALSIAGDLFESLLKRQAGVKDSGRVLPGHGGVLDRIDASIPALPAAALIDWCIR